MMSNAIEGILNVDKPIGVTSHDVVRQIRHISRIRRVGHAGTLDPLATGVLLVGLGRATRLIEYMTTQPKTYETIVRLGQTTDTYDAEGELLLERLIPPLTEMTLEQTLETFRGVINQYPPLYSAVKKDGQPLYKLARRGIEVERPLRQVTIYELRLLSWVEPYLHLRITCSAGTYIRSLAHDLGEHLGCGGHVAALRRTAVGAFTVDESVAIDRLTNENFRSYLLNNDAAVSHLPRLDLSLEETSLLQRGQPITRQPHQPIAPLVRVYNAVGQFIGVAAAKEASWQARKILHPGEPV